MNPLRLKLILIPLLAFGGGLTALRAAELPVIAKARAYLGGEQALSAITAIHYYGKLEAGVLDERGELTKKSEMSVDIAFQKPYRQRSVLVAPKETKTTVLDGFDAWERLEDPKNPSRWRLNVLGPDQIESMRANAWENLAFFRGLAAEGGTVQDLGETKEDGVTCHEVAFIHSPQIIFYRYFDPGTGRLVLTKTVHGEIIRESGMIEAGGVKFPQVLSQVIPGGNGRPAQKVIITFSKITVNQPLPESQFDMPLLVNP